MIKALKFLLMIWVCMGHGISLSGQQKERYLEVRGYVELDMKPLVNAVATLYDGNTRVSSVPTGTEGSFSFKLESNKMYTVEVTKDGLVTKKISFNTNLPDEESGVWVREFAMVLMRPCEGVDYSILQKPVDIIKFNLKRRDFESDKDYVEQMRPKFEDVLMKSENCLSDKYERLISQADKQFSQKAYGESRSTYQQALDIMPGEAGPKKRIAEIDAILEKQKSDETLYAKTISEADALFSQQQYSEALAKYKTASVLNPRETYSAKKINEIQTILAKQQTDKQAAVAADARFNDLIAKAGEAYAQKEYETAKKLYQEALLIKPSESAPQNKIREIDNLLTRQKSVDDAYLTAVAEADALYKEKKYDAAKEAYAKAISIKPSESYPRTRTDEVDKAIQQQEQKKLDVRREELTRNLDSYLDEGDSQFKAKNYEAARAAYAEAIKIKPDQGYAKQQIGRIDKIIASEQASRQKSVEDDYQNAIDRADAAMTQEQFALAKEQYQLALTIKPDDAFAKTRIDEAERLMQEQIKNRAAMELQNRKYQEAIASADKLYQAKDLKGAVAGYQQALSIKPGDIYAQQRITGIENALAAEQTAKQKAMEAELAAKQKAIEDGYSSAINRANNAFSQKQYSQAKEQYQNALAFKSEDAFARNRIAEIDHLLRQEQGRLAAEQARKKQYDDAINRADKLFMANDYSNSKTTFEEASRILPDESYPKQKIAEIDKIVADQQKALADKQAKDKIYNEAVKNGDMYFSLKNYNDARSEYNKALSVKPEETYPKNRITEIENLIKAEQKAQFDARAKTDAYNAAISSGNTAYGQKKYNEAISFYKQALKIEPEDAYAKDQILLVENLLAEQEKQKRAEQAKQKQYSDLISIADKAFDAANYAVAKENYQKALAVMPDNPYPKQRIARIDEINKLLAQQQLKNAQQTAVEKSSKQKISSAAPLAQLNFKNDAERDLYLNELKKKYPEGITVEIYKEKYRETRRYVIVRDDVATEFRDILIKTYGGHEYTMNGRTITQMYFDQQVKRRPGEYYKETIYE
ncbi:MAG: hypothetical protein JW973_05020 [Bacteroidales bacterium]|nr:hypothetical protein [Bacteroidales bacterium]